MRVSDWLLGFGFFESRRRHTIGALVTGIQMCALPISRSASEEPQPDDIRFAREVPQFRRPERPVLSAPGEARGKAGITTTPALNERSEERRVGKAWGSTCRSRWPTYH